MSYNLKTVLRVRLHANGICFDLVDIAIERCIVWLLLFVIMNSYNNIEQ